MRLHDLGQRHLHRRHPLSALVQPLVVGPLRPAAVGEDRRAARGLSLPRPRVALDGQLVRCCAALAVEEAGDVLLALGIVADDLDSAPIRVASAAVGGVEDEEPASRLLVDVAGEYPDRRRLRSGHGVSLVDPLPDNDVQLTVLCTRPGLL